MNSESNKTLWIVLASVLFGHGLLAQVSSGAGETGVVRTLILDGLTPFEKLFDASIHGAVSVWNSYLALLDTRRENERLREENSELRLAIQRNRETVLEAERLRRLLDLEPRARREQVAARVIGRDTSVSRRTVTIDKGTLHGLHVNAAVITEDGVVGRIIHTGHYSSVVQLVSDPESAVGVVVRTSRAQGIVEGDGTRYLQLDHVDDNDELLPADELVTSGTDQIYPKGLPLGVVVAVGPVRDMMKTARVEPAADLAKLEEVLCLVAPSGTTELRTDPDDPDGPLQLP